MADLLGDFAKSLVSVSSTSLNTVNGVIDVNEVPFLASRDVLKLFVRSCYVDLAGLILRRNRDSRKRQFVVSGSPGMGKSYFGLYMLAKLFNECGAKIIYYQTELFGKYIFTINDDQIPQFTRVFDPMISFEQLLYESPKGTWYIVDGIEPHFIRHINTLLITSPRRSIWRQFQKQFKAAMYYIPIWSWDELQLCHTLIYSDIVSKDVVNSRFSKWGGNARYIFSDPDQEATNESYLLKAVLKAKSIGSFLDLINNPDPGKEDVTHLLLHYIVNVDDDDCKYLVYHLAPASKYVFNTVADRLLDKMHLEVVSFIMASGGSYTYDDPTSQLRGYLFEGLAHRYLTKGGKFSIRSLRETNTSIEEMDIQPAESVERFSSWPSQLKPVVYYRPMSSNFPVIDAFRCSSHEVILFQMTIATRHPIVHQELKDTISRFEGQGYTVKRLYFVVPDSIFASFPSQTYHTKQKKVMENVDSRVKAIEQYALRILLHHALSDKSPESKRSKTDCD